MSGGERLILESKGVVAIRDIQAMPRRLRLPFWILLSVVLWAATQVLSAQAPASSSDDLQWIRPIDNRLEWLNVADWEARTGGLQPVRVPQTWRQRWPERTAFRALSAAGVSVRLKTDSSKLVFRLIFREVPERPNLSAEVLWERSRPNYFDVYRDGVYISSVSAPISYVEQDVILLDGSGDEGQESEIEVLFPHYYRNAEVILDGIGLARNAQLTAPMPRGLPRVLFHGDSITHGHGVTTPRETFVWQACKLAGCIPYNLGFGGSAWGDQVVAEYIASRSDWDVLVIAIGTNSLGGMYAGQPETAEQYGAKYDTFLVTIRAKFPNKPILCITPIWNSRDAGAEENRNGETAQDYRNAITQVVEQRQKADGNLYLLDGLTLVNKPIYLLVTDMVHPNMAGSLRMAEGIAAALKPVLSGL